MEGLSVTQDGLEKVLYKVDAEGARCVKVGPDVLWLVESGIGV